VTHSMNGRGWRSKRKKRWLRSDSLARGEEGISVRERERERERAYTGTHCSSRISQQRLHVAVALYFGSRYKPPYIICAISSQCVYGIGAGGTVRADRHGKYTDDTR